MENESITKKSSPLLEAVEPRILSLRVDKMSLALDSSRAFSLSRGMFLTLCTGDDAASPSTFFLPSTLVSMHKLETISSDTDQSHGRSQTHTVILTTAVPPTAIPTIVSPTIMAIPRP